MSTEPQPDGGRTLPERIRAPFEGPNTIGNSKPFWSGFLVALGLFVLYPLLAPVLGGVPVVSGLLLGADQLSVFFVVALLALSLALVWGYSGVLSFGQVVFFGIGGYTFGVASINFSTPAGITGSVLLGILFGGLSAAVLGYFMFYGGVRDVYVTIITLVATMVMLTFMAQTAGSEWTIGKAALGGFNGMPDIPLLKLGIGGFSFQFVFNAMPVAVPGYGTVEVSPFYYLSLVLLLASYLGLRALVNSDYGRVMVAVREDEDRTEMFGYNTTRVKFTVFTLGGALAGLSGVLFAARNVYIDPSVFSLLRATLPVIWVSVGGRKSLLGAVVATIGIEYLRISLAGEWALVALGGVLVVSVLLLPGGLVPWIHNRVVRWRSDSGELAGPESPDSPTEVSD
jgi:branched-chain amino acid transport system permease protein